MKSDIEIMCLPFLYHNLAVLITLMWFYNCRVNRASSLVGWWTGLSRVSSTRLLFSRACLRTNESIPSSRGNSFLFYYD